MYLPNSTKNEFERSFFGRIRKDMAISPTDAGRLVGLRNTLVKTFARIEGSWENLLQSARDCDESVAFITISELVEVTEDTTS